MADAAGGPFGRKTMSHIAIEAGKPVAQSGTTWLAGFGPLELAAARFAIAALPAALFLAVTPPRQPRRQLHVLRPAGGDTAGIRLAG